ncbi:nuclear transport factor 2 family protein [Nocardia sp. CDC159]|uniref:Nuclear transport factor 2 family protein n=1 Tax=Nocardia pulmonis TaxID=2951408 RepID=A0A9X2IWN6_9NOCA|nr:MULTISPECIES: nuclear transport factor 2 family protein [Nocardia]MCM6773754.1 nuclear transport factor 2 family protein [Nocardia pulmonis]MCM6786641.1 nuclear transport factor 2 family protein [Nocardia sp. CDC159]
MSSPPAAGGRNEAVEREIIRRSDEWAAAIVANDAVALAEFVSDDWVFVTDQGISPGSQFLDLVRAGRLTHSAMTRIGEPRIRVYGNTAVCTARVTNTAHYEGRRYDADEWTTDVFVERDGKWVCVLTQLTNCRGSGE